MHWLLISISSCWLSTQRGRDLCLNWHGHHHPALSTFIQHAFPSSLTLLNMIPVATFCPWCVCPTMPCFLTLDVDYEETVLINDHVALSRHGGLDFVFPWQKVVVFKNLWRQESRNGLGWRLLSAEAGTGNELRATHIVAKHVVKGLRWQGKRPQQLFPDSQLLGLSSLTTRFLREGMFRKTCLEFV